MADNIRIIGNINDIQRVNRLKLEDLNLLNLQVKNQTFGFENDYIEYFVYDGGGNLINSNYNYRDFKLPSDSYLSPGSKLPIIEIDPTTDLQSLGYISGQFKTQYNFQTKKVSSSDADLFISEISDNRTEIGIKSTIISSEDLIGYGNNLINELENSLDQKYFVLNLSNNTQVLIINVAVKIEDSSILLKLYEPLSQNIFEKETGWITEEIIEPYVFDINLDTSVIPADSPILRGPNFDIDVDIKQNVNTNYQNYSSLVSSLTGSSYQQVLNYMNSDSYDLNIDYTTFNNFIHFSSAKKRLNIFYDKVKQIENYNNNINIIVNSTNILKNEQTASIKIQIDNLTQNFDGFENYMYFESSSYTWPKSNSNKPYSLLSTGSIQTWYNNYTSSAENYDEDNLDRLYNILPNYIKNDPNSYQNYYDFIDMIGHYFDNIWIYISSINELYNADNNLEKGVSKDIVYDALQSLGVKLYNSKGDDNFNDYISGLNSGSTLFTDDFSVTSSYLNNIPKKDLLAETYKRIYHNIPLLSKTRGTTTGLQNLITAFGISSSILSPKEFGGSTKKNEIKGFDNDKITIQNNSITGSVLSPFISLQTSPTASTEFTSTDLHFIDLSFSPQNELNTRLSASIANLNPTFSLDEYIGDPGLMASSSYQSLIQQNDYHISASSAVSGSEKSLDYKGFIELVKYFDNSLFKMLKDFVPARTNALTGITIKSSVLERNKIPIYQPKITEEIIYDAEYNAPIISEDRDYYYNELEGNKSSFYTGQITGSYVNIYSYFDDEHINPYLHPTESIDINKFNHTDFNIILNNVSTSIQSTNRNKIENIYNSDLQIIGSYSSSAELQDSQLNLLGHKRSRYDGTRLSSLKYNTYTTSSLTYGGDISFGKSAVIDSNNIKFGTVRTVTPTNLNFLDKSNIKLKYLVTKDSDLDELNLENKKWFEVQNTFKSGENLIISLSDPSKDKSKFSGEKTIWQSGYSYNPIIYRESNETLYFEYTSSIGTYNGKLGVKAYTTSSFKYEYDDNQVAIPPSQPSFPTTVLGQENTQHEYKWYINGSPSLTANNPMASIVYGTGSWMHQSIPGLNATTNQMDLTGSNGTVSNITFSGGRNYQLVYGFDLLDFAKIDYNSEYNNDVYQTLNSKYYLYKTPRSSTYIISGSAVFNILGYDTGEGDQAGPSVFRAVCVVEKTLTPSDDYSWTHVAHTTLIPITNYQQNNGSSDLIKYNKDQSTIWFDFDMIRTATFRLNVETTANIDAGYYVRFRFYWIDLAGAFAPTPSSGGANGLTFSLDNNSSFEIYDNLTPKINYITTGSIDQSTPLFTLATTNVSNDTLVFNNITFNQFLHKSYFIPSFAFGGSYTTPVDLISFNSQDLVRAGRFDDPGSKYYNVVTSSIISGEYKVVVDNSIDTTLISGAQNFAIFRKKPDETSIYINNPKNPGILSDKMYIIPVDLSGSIKNDIGNILQKLDPSIIS
jgi:hypothetical protein